MMVGHPGGSRASERGMGWTRRLKACGLPLVALILLLGNPLLSWAHSDPFAPVAIDQSIQHSCQAPTSSLPPTQVIAGAIPWALVAFTFVVLLAGVMAPGRRQCRRAALCGLVLVLGTFALGTAVHAVHHLDEPQKAAECSVFSASQHVTGTLAEPGAVQIPMFASEGTASGACEAPTFTPRFQSAQPRAPPSSPAS
jgi:hypothetical protein